jgi:hypothetical protein
VAQGLEVTRSRGLFNENVTSFYDKLEKLYKLHNYDSSYIWNCDELGVQAGRGGQGNYWPKMNLTMFIQLHWKNGNGLLFSHASMPREQVFPTFTFSRAKGCQEITLCIGRVVPQGHATQGLDD